MAKLIGYTSLPYGSNPATARDCPKCGRSMVLLKFLDTQTIFWGHKRANEDCSVLVWPNGGICQPDKRSGRSGAVVPVVAATVAPAVKPAYRAPAVKAPAPVPHAGLVALAAALRWVTGARWSGGGAIAKFNSAWECAHADDAARTRRIEEERAACTRAALKGLSAALGVICAAWAASRVKLAVCAGMAQATLADGTIWTVPAGVPALDRALGMVSATGRDQTLRAPALVAAIRAHGERDAAAARYALLDLD